MKFLVIALIGLIANPSFATDVCEVLAGEGSEVEVNRLRSGDVVTEENWKNLDVLFNYDYNKCKPKLEQSLLKVGNELVWQLATKDDSCDGGNTYGVVYSYDLKTAVAHIYDGDVYCKKNWSEDSIAPKADAKKYCSGGNHIKVSVEVSMGMVTYSERDNSYVKVLDRISSSANSYSGPAPGVDEVVVTLKKDKKSVDVFYWQDPSGYSIKLLPENCN